MQGVSHPAGSIKGEITGVQGKAVKKTEGELDRGRVGRTVGKTESSMEVEKEESQAEE